jgi:recombination protein RecA
MTTDKDLEKKYGKGVLMDASFLLEEERSIIPLTPALNIPLRGGVQEGSLLALSGASGSGKSTTALQLIANGQKAENGGRSAYYLDVEHRLKKSNLEGIHGLDWQGDKFKIVRSTEEKIYSAEEYLNIALDILKTRPKSILIIDSASALCGNGEMTEEVKSDFRNNNPKLLANFCRHIAPILMLNKQIVVLLQHLIADTSGKGMGGPQEDGGNKIKHQADIRMRIKWTEKWEAGSGENSRRIGQVLHWQIVKSPFGPVDKIDSYLRYGYGLDAITESIMLACDIGYIIKGGSWFTLDFLDDKPKLQGQEKVYDHLLNNPKDFNKLNKIIQESLK